MITVLLVILTIAGYCGATMMMKAYQVSVGPGHFQTAFMNVALSGAVFLVFVAARGFHLRHTPLTLILAIAFGAGGYKIKDVFLACLPLWFLYGITVIIMANLRFPMV